MARAAKHRLRGPWRRIAAEEKGSAIVEFIFASTILLIPMVYLVLAAAALEGGSYAVVSAADQAAKVFAVAENPGQARDNAQAAADRAMANFGFSAARTSISCNGECLSPGSVVSVTVSLEVPLPLLSGAIHASAFTVDATAVQRVDRFG